MAFSLFKIPDCLEVWEIPFAEFCAVQSDQPNSHLQSEAEYLYFLKQIAGYLFLPTFQDKSIRCFVKFEREV